jgi:hypothetical protein
MGSHPLRGFKRQCLASCADFILYMSLSITETPATRVSSSSENQTSYDNRPLYTFSLLKTYQQIHCEMHFLSFKLNKFIISSATALYLWLPKPVVRHQLQSIQTLQIYTMKGLVEQRAD